MKDYQLIRSSALKQTENLVDILRLDSQNSFDIITLYNKNKKIKVGKGFLVIEQKNQSINCNVEIVFSCPCFYKVIYIKNTLLVEFPISWAKSNKISQGDLILNFNSFFLFKENFRDNSPS